ncbi:MAG TPA: carbohydrate kinase family protein [Steroidobacteraceae bacterium]|nr:carbohydrate kinase family protein [Steroidobacteraceae bacterium]HTL92272.1 carbohydrate kinase family protein [Steroidobacteraceae bacterium]
MNERPRKALICGSAAFDTIMVFEGRFREHILAEQIHILNVSFLVPKLRREFGGCAGNIAYNLSLLGDPAVPMATVGRDFAPYRDWMRQIGLPLEHVRVVDSELTAQAFITTDLDDNQITAFHPGAMQHAHLNKVIDAEDVVIGIVAPDGRRGMIEHAEQFAGLGIPFIFDPGQGLPMFEAADLDRFIEHANWVALNDYEWQLLQQKTGWTVRDLTLRVEALIVTRGPKGSSIYTQDGEFEIPCAKTSAVIDPTGCGDAYRAGLLHGLLHNLDYETCGRIAAVMGALKIESRGTQNHRATPEQIRRRVAESFGDAAAARMVLAAGH